jgi:hypothetical protein
MLGVPKYITNTHTGRGYRSDRFSKPVRPVLSRNLPKTLPRENLPQEPLLLGTRIVIVQQGLPCSRTLHDSPQDQTGQTGLENRSDQFWSGQSGRTQPAGKTQPFHQSIRSTDQSETLGIDGVPRGLPMARSSVHKTQSIKRS